jgi:hypothetical protein
MFPYMSGMMYMLGLDKAPGVSMRSPWDGMPADATSETDHNIQPWDLGSARTAPTTFHGDGSGSPITVDPDARRHALGAGLTAFGASMLKHAADRGGLAAGLGEGAEGFSQAFGGEMDKARQEAVQNLQIRHQQTADDRAADEARDRHRASDQEYTINDAKLASAKQKAADDAQSAVATTAAAKKMVSNIKAVAQANPADPKLQAMASEVDAFDLGDTSDLTKLATLHQQLLGQAFHAQDSQQQTNDLIAGKKAEIQAGVVSNPADAEADRRRGLDIAQGQLNVSRDRAAVGRGVSNIPPGKIYASIQKKVDTKMKAAEKAYHDTPRGSLRPPTPDMREKWRKQALAEATAEVQSQAQTALRFTKDGRFIPDTSADDNGDEP